MSRPTDPSSHLDRQRRALRNRNSPRPVIPARPALNRGGTSVPAAAGSALPPPAAAVPEQPRKKFRWWAFALLLLVQILLFAALFSLGRSLRQQTEDAMLEVRYQIPGMEDLTESIVYGHYALLRDPVTPRGFTFLGWQDEEGRFEERDRFPVYRNMVFTAKLMPAFEQARHIPYLTTDLEAVLDVDGPVTVREFVQILYLLLDTEETGSGRFVDVDRDDSCYEAAAYLKDLGILTGSRLRPDANLLCGEMIETLCRFFPAVETEDCSFQDLDPDDPWYSSFCTAVKYGWLSSGSLVRTGAMSEISRGRFARIMNHVLHRDALRDLDPTDVGTIMDVPPSGEYYSDVVEAVIPHTYRLRNGREIWTSSEALPVHEPGFFFTGVRIHYIDENYAPAVNGTFNGLDYNRNGEVTSGDAELDRALWEILENLIDPETMDREEMLRVVYDYVVDNYTYRYGSMYAFGAEGWAVQEAKRMLEYGSGNCYCFAALFYELARFVGYDAKIYSGSVYGEQYEFRDYDHDLVVLPYGNTPHGWVEIRFDDTDYIFDTEYEYRSWGLLDMFKADDAIRRQYGYKRDDNASGR